MRERAVRWAKKYPASNLYFAVVRMEEAEQTSLLEMELEYFFHEMHKLSNVTVLGLPTAPEDTLKSLFQEATTRAPGSWMVDELIMPNPKEHQQWAEDLQRLQNYMTVQIDRPLLWIAMAAVVTGKAEHFKRSYLTHLLPPVFHIPEMNMPLRSTKRVLETAQLGSQTNIKGLGSGGASYYPKSNPEYTVPPQLMAGPECDHFLLNNTTLGQTSDIEELENVVEAASKELLRRTGGAGFPILFDTYGSEASARLDWTGGVKRGVERSGATVLIYHKKMQSCSENEVREWLKRKKSGEEERCLLLDEWNCRGWESSHVLVVAFYGNYHDGWENLVMRTVGYCALVIQNTEPEHRVRGLWPLWPGIRT